MNKDRLESILCLAGFKILDIWETTNRYWGKNDITGPWWLVNTEYGMITIGWRKRVIDINWEKTGIACDVTKDDVTKSQHNVHAWSELDAVKYLTELKKQLEANKPFDVKGELEKIVKQWCDASREHRNTYRANNDKRYLGYAEMLDAASEEVEQLILKIK